MEKKLRSVTKVVGILDLLSITAITIWALVQGANFDFTFCARILMCLAFATALLQLGKGNVTEMQKSEDKKKLLFYFFIVCGVIVSFIANYMFYEEMVLGRDSETCIMAALGAYILFDTANKEVKR